jgi:cysteine desulfurase/selenocysteine lyase
MTHPDFPDRAARAYLNHAAVGPLPAVARAAVLEALTEQGAHGSAAIGPWLGRLELGRAAIADLLGVAAPDVAYIPNTSTGVHAVAHGTIWAPGDRIVLFRGEFPANVLPWLRAAERHDLGVDWIDADAFQGPSGDGLAQLETTLRAGRVRIVAVSAVQFQTGLRMPVSELGRLAHAHGARVFVDAIQALGASPLDLDHADFLAAGGYKWLMGPQGSGVFWARPDAWASLTPELTGWLSQTDPLRFLGGEPGAMVYNKPWRLGPPTLEGATMPFAAHLGLAASVALLRARMGTADAVFDHVQPLLDRAEQALTAAGWRSRRAEAKDQRSTLLCLRPPPGVEVGATVARLADAGIVVGSPDGHLRVAPSWPTSPDEIDALIASFG